MSMYINMNTYIHRYIYIYAHVCIRINVCIYVYIHIHTCVCKYIYTHVDEHTYSIGGKDRNNRGGCRFKEQVERTSIRVNSIRLDVDACI